jgi:hypothetical protein
MATFAQLAASNTLPEPPLADTTNSLSAAFGLGGLVTAAALAASTTPTPTEPGAASFAGLAVSISAPLTWSGVHSGWTARMWAAAAATAGAANDVPESCMYPGETTFVGRSSTSVEVTGTGPTM